jgi:DEAD/DEAH box helicase domain-containing protein
VIEQGLRKGAVKAVVATNALELGIDIGQLDAAILAGHPGTIASARQQMGRAGRRQGASVAVFVAGAEPLDQYIVTHPRWLLDRSPEHARINPNNEIILAGHLACAAAELPMQETEEFSGSFPLNQREMAPFTGASTIELLVDLVEAGQLYLSNGRYFWAGEAIPPEALSLRSAGNDRIAIQARGDDGKPAVIGELDREGVPLLLYRGAVYLHEGTSYVVEGLNWEAGVATVRAIDADFYTRPITGEKIEILAVRGSAADKAPLRGNAGQALSYDLGWGDVRVTSQTTGYKILRRNTGEVLGFGEVDLPEQCWKPKVAG